MAADSVHHASGGGRGQQRNFVIGRKRLWEDVQMGSEPDVSIGVQLAREIDKFQNVLARNSILLREVQSAYYSLSCPVLPSYASTSKTTADALRATTLERGGEMLAEINENLTHVAAMYKEVSKSFMERLAEGADNLGGANDVLDETQRRNDAFDNEAAAAAAAAAVVPAPSSAPN